MVSLAPVWSLCWRVFDDSLSSAILYEFYYISCLSSGPLSQVPHEMSVPYFRNNAQFLAFGLLYAVVNLALFIGRCWEYRNFKNSDGTRNWWIIVARANGEGSAAWLEI